MKIQGYHIYLRQLQDHQCPRCEEYLNRYPLPGWQKLVSLILPLRHYKCSGCNRHFLAFSPRWNRLNILEKFMLVTATVLYLVALSLILFWLLFALFSRVMI
ncbi:MAG: hypothetical protein ACUVRL_11005 [Candidatus Saccharicenans sp.]|uniref:hypothetical protein n=1 Tax=Candidatus Saccharicenans sp. TaxID=2819258 RepID=UPI00404B82BE